MVGGYAVRKESRHDGPKWLRMHRLIAEAPDGVEVDHINRDRLDNRRSNLRLTDRAGNARNRSRNMKSTSGFKGIRRYGRKSSRWVAEIRFERHTHFLGIYATAEEAAVTYDLAAMALHGEFAATNFVHNEDLPLLAELRSLLLWFIDKRLRWHQKFDKLRDRLTMLHAAALTMPDSSNKVEAHELLHQIAFSAAQVLRAD